MDRNSTMKVLIKSLLEPVSNFHINRFLYQIRLNVVLFSDYSVLVRADSGLRCGELALNCRVSHIIKLDRAELYIWIFGHYQKIFKRIISEFVFFLRIFRFKLGDIIWDALKLKEISSNQSINLCLGYTGCLSTERRITIVLNVIFFFQLRNYSQNTGTHIEGK